MSCDKHKKYTGKRKPKYECIGCLNLYIKLHGAPRAPYKPTRIIKSKKKYNRKKVIC